MADTTEHREINPDEMAALVDSGDATPLLAGYRPVPCHHNGQWWHVSAAAVGDDAPYVPADRDQHEVFTELADRLARADAAQAAADHGRSQ